MSENRSSNNNNSNNVNVSQSNVRYAGDVVDLESGVSSGELGLSLLNNISRRDRVRNMRMAEFHEPIVISHAVSVDDGTRTDGARTDGAGTDGAGTGVMESDDSFMSESDEDGARNSSTRTGDLGGVPVAGSDGFASLRPLPTVSNIVANAVTRINPLNRYRNRYGRVSSSGVGNYDEAYYSIDAGGTGRRETVRRSLDNVSSAHDIIQNVSYKNVDRNIERIMNRSVDSFNNLTDRITENLENNYEDKVFFKIAEKVGINIEELIHKLNLKDNNFDIELEASGSKFNDFNVDEGDIDTVVVEEMKKLVSDINVENYEPVEYVAELLKRYRFAIDEHFDNLVQCEVQIKSAVKKIFKLTDWLKSIQNISDEIDEEFGTHDYDNDNDSDSDDNDNDESLREGKGDISTENPSAVDEIHEVENLNVGETKDGEKVEKPVPEIQREFYGHLEGYSRHLIDKIDVDRLVFDYEVSRKCLAELMKLSGKINGLQTSHLCIICTTNEVDTVIVPCGHTCCSKCLDRMNSVTSAYNRKCYVCKTKIVNYQKIYFM